MAGYIKIGDIKGESTQDPDTFNFKSNDKDGNGDSGHGGWIDILSMGGGGGRAPGKPDDGGIDFVEWTYSGGDGSSYTEVEWTY